MKSGRNTDAELEFKQLALAYPEFAGPQVNLGLLYLHASRYADAEGAFKAALARSPDNAIASDELGIAERKLGKFAEAEAAYQHTIAVEPNYAPAYLNLGVLYDLYLAQPQKALEQFEHYLTLAGDNKQVAGWVIELKKRVGAPAAARRRKEGACMSLYFRSLTLVLAGLASPLGALAQSDQAPPATSPSQSSAPSSGTRSPDDAIERPERGRGAARRDLGRRRRRAGGSPARCRP